MKEKTINIGIHELNFNDRLTEEVNYLIDDGWHVKRIWFGGDKVLRIEMEPPEQPQAKRDLTQEALDQHLPRPDAPAEPEPWSDKSHVADILGMPRSAFREKRREPDFPLLDPEP